MLGSGRSARRFRFGVEIGYNERVFRFRHNRSEQVSQLLGHGKNLVAEVPHRFRPAYETHDENVRIGEPVRPHGMFDVRGDKDDLALFQRVRFAARDNEQLVFVAVNYLPEIVAFARVRVSFRKLLIVDSDEFRNIQKPVYFVHIKRFLHFLSLRYHYTAFSRFCKIF